MSASTPSYLPLPQLAAGVRVVARGRRELQIGLLPGRSLVVERNTLTTTALRALERGEPTDARARPLLARLAAAGLLREHDTPPEVRIGLAGTSGINATDVLAAIGHRLVEPEIADAVIVTATGEIPRALVDGLIRRHTPHVVVRSIDGTPVLGPFVVPGQTACLRCIDAHHFDRDRSYLAVVDQYATACARPRRDGASDIADPSAVALAVVWAANDIRAWAAGQTPLTWSTTLSTPPKATGYVATVWRRHPECGCHWVPGESAA